MKKLLLVLAAVGVLGACKKDSEPAPISTAPRTELLTAHKWKPSSGTYSISTNGSSGFTTDAFTDCEKDNIYTFNADKSLVEDAGAVKCTTLEPQSETGSWALANNDQKLTINLPNQAINGELDIQKLTTTKLHVSATKSVNGSTLMIDATYVSY